MKLPQLRVSPETVRMLKLGHPWVIADGHTRRWPAGSAGDLVQLTDEGGRMLATALLDPAERVVARVLEFRPMALDKSWLAGRLRAAQALRRNHGLLGQSDAYRLVNAEGDGLSGLVIDRYGDYLLVQCYAGCWQPHLDTLAAALLEVVAPVGIYVKERPKDTRKLPERKGDSEFGRLLAGSRAPSRLVVEENGLHFLVNLVERLHTGLFPDQRVNRRDLMERASGKRVLNLFSYTGAFSVAAAAGGAKQVTSVDASAPVMEWARENFGLNRINPRNHEFLVGDVFQVLEDLARQQRRYDIVVMDPPAHSTTRHNRFATVGGTSRTVAGALLLLEPGGLLLASCNHQKVSEADYLKELRRGALEAGVNLRVLRFAGQPEDFPFPVGFPEGRYLKFAVCVRD